MKKQFKAYKTVSAAIAFLLVLLSSGCESSANAYERLPLQDDAEGIVWCQMYHEHQSPPPVEWIHNLDCSGGYGFIAEDGLCVGGFYRYGEYAQVATWDKAKFSDTAYAHELLHAHLYNLGNSDHNHSGPEWQPGGLLYITVENLMHAGL